MQRKFRFTLADDDSILLFFIHSLVAQAYPGSNIASFTSPHDAMQHILAMGADLVITDHGMGEMTGTEMIQHLRNRGFTNPIFMVSGSPDAKAEALAAGATMFLDKTVAGQSLISEMKKLLSV